MSDSVSTSLRRSIAAIRRSSGRPRYPAALKARAVSFGQQRQTEGVSRRRAALEIGLPIPTLALWMRQETEGDSFRPVKAAEDEAGRGQEETPRSLSLVSPSGCRVEGLSLGDVAALRRALG